MSSDLWLAILAFLLMMLGAATSIHPPKDLRWKIAVLLIFAILGVSSLALIYGQTKERNQADSNNVAAQKQLQASADHSQQELISLKGQIADIQRIAEQPGSSPNERLVSVLDSIDKTLGKPKTPRSLVSSPLPAAVPVSTINVDGIFPIKTGRPRLADILASGKYAGSSSILEWTICNRSTSTSIYQGGAQVDDKSFGLELEPGSCSTERASIQGDVIDANQIFFYTREPSTVSIKARGMKAN
jgi:hypothetical protein